MDEIFFVPEPETSYIFEVEYWFASIETSFMFFNMDKKLKAVKLTLPHRIVPVESEDLQLI